jgi:hypothetical protein
MKDTSNKNTKCKGTRRVWRSPDISVVLMGSLMSADIVELLAGDPAALDHRRQAHAGTDSVCGDEVEVWCFAERGVGVQGVQQSSH